MMTTNKLTKILSGVAVLGIASAIAAPAQAGTLGWSNGTSDFFGDVNPGAGDTFSVTFSGAGQAFVSTANGEFVPPFTFTDNTIANPPYTTNLTPAVGNFEFVTAFNANSGEYKLTNDLAFAFSNGATVTWEAGTIFEYLFDEPGSVEFQLGDDPDNVPLVTGIQPYDYVLPTDVLQFGDEGLSDGGVYDAEVQVSVPEPGTILGLLAVGGLGLVSRFKKQK